MEVVASLSQGRTAAAKCGLFTHKSVPVTFEPPCNFEPSNQIIVPTGYNVKTEEAKISLSLSGFVLRIRLGLLPFSENRVV